MTVLSSQACSHGMFKQIRIRAYSTVFIDFNLKIMLKCNKPNGTVLFKFICDAQYLVNNMLEVLLNCCCCIFFKFSNIDKKKSFSSAKTARMI